MNVPYHTLEIKGNRYTWVVEIANSQESVEAMIADGVDIQEIIQVIPASDELIASVVASNAISEAKRG